MPPRLNIYIYIFYLYILYGATTGVKVADPWSIGIEILRTKIIICLANAEVMLKVLSTPVSGVHVTDGLDSMNTDLIYQRPALSSNQMFWWF